MSKNLLRPVIFFHNARCLCKNDLRVSSVVKYVWRLHEYSVLLIRKISCDIRCLLSLEWAIFLTLVWHDHITRTFLSADIYRNMIFSKIKISPPHTYEHRYVKFLTTSKLASPVNIFIQLPDLKRQKSYNLTTKKFRTL